ncbi:MAG: hypothetical protein P8X47_04925 [Ignavibacteriaceae bacterium]
MKNEEKILLIVDGVVNTLLGLVLFTFPFGSGEILGLPKSENNFYPMILGAVLLGIGIALFIEVKYFYKGKRGLGLDGAIVINMVAGVALILILIFGQPNVSTTGLIILWIVGLSVLIIGFVEYFRDRILKK